FDLLDSADEGRKEHSTLVFLGDNFSEAEQLPWKEEWSALKNFPGEIVFLPGELEWGKDGIDGLEKITETLTEQLEREELFQPVSGCGLTSIDISDEVHLLVLDSQWFLADWNEHPLVNDDCPEIKTRKALFAEVEPELKKNQEKTTIIALHDHLLSNGAHGGKNGWSSYLAPNFRKIPVPVVGQVANLLRSSGGTSIQDAGNPQYSAFVARLRTIGKKWGKVVFASGHDHSLQYLEDEFVKQIVTGSGSITSYAGEGKFGKFAADETGFAVLDVYDNGSSEVRFYNSEQELLFQSEVFPKEEPYNTYQLPGSFPDTFTATIYDQEQTEKSNFYIN